MTETIDLIANDTPARTLLNVLCGHGGSKNVDKYTKKLPDGRPDKMADVQLFVNGIEVPYSEMVGSAWEIRQEEVNRMVAEKLQEYLKNEKLKAFIREVDDLAYKFQDKFEELLGEKIDWPNNYD